MKSRYIQEHLHDDFEWAIWLTIKGKQTKKIRAYGYKIPPQLDSLEKSFLVIRDSLKLKPLGQELKFGSRVGFYPKPVGALKGLFPDY